MGGRWCFDVVDAVVLLVARVGPRRDDPRAGLGGELRGSRWSRVAGRGWGASSSTTIELGIYSERTMRKRANKGALSPDSPFASTEADIGLPRGGLAGRVLILVFAVFLLQGLYTFAARASWNQESATRGMLLLALHVGAAGVGLAGATLLVRTHARRLAVACIALGFMGLAISFAVLIGELQ